LILTASIEVQHRNPLPAIDRDAFLHGQKSGVNQILVAAHYLWELKKYVDTRPARAIVRQPENGSLVIAMRSGPEQASRDHRERPSAERDRAYRRIGISLCFGGYGLGEVPNAVSGRPCQA
jgi:hypothetical protein